ncbi:MAG: DNA recombination protein RmuC [Anaerovoracaceae bacterium]
MENALFIILALICAVSAAVMVVCTVVIKRQSGDRGLTRNDIDSAVSTYGGMMMQAQKTSAEAQDRRLQSIDARMENFSDSSEQKLESIRRTLSAEMEQLNREVGSMQKLAKDVDGLSKVLSNVKTRGILGEYQCEAILRDMLSPYQYEKNVNTTGAGNERVEFAVKVPDETGSLIYLPIDSKFPLDTYTKLEEAREGADQAEIRKAAGALAARFRSEAQDIRAKYVAPPKTTDFALLFVPTESLYFEALRLGIFEELQRDLSVIVVGPTSLSAFLSSLQTGYRAAAVNRKSAEVWRTLAAVKTEFSKFSSELEKARADIAKADKRLDSMVGTRTNVMMKKLEDVTEMTEEEADREFGFGSGEAASPEINIYGGDSSI